MPEIPPLLFYLVYGADEKVHGKGLMTQVLSATIILNKLMALRLDKFRNLLAFQMLMMEEDYI